ncbi:patatin-like phospholipase family protein [Pontiella agarivorans]|uniref:Patatin-like phospholipase family protein n=1 Tax=Pontiella agarivorans TaxID=3038953 RepID=A0ABU5N1N0_9BACT|nr:patatin-like phospholipase family protein [Pontiella agarivorans]MDZ8120359.1 patatin-like phospholipase family protein [Pontiella agarivorans]
MLRKRLFILTFCMALTSVARTETHRPKIGLVLGGGGALGFAHVGVIRELEKLNIPIDYIGGTSMGAIVAGMYASGMTPDEMEQSFTQLDWWDVLKDQSPHQYLVYRRKQDDNRYMGAELGFNHWALQYRPGMAYGQKLNNVLETFSLNSTGIADFDDLNIPYRAIATDLRKGESVILKDGDLSLAMRASMAVPGVFTPVRIGDRIFVDGGIFNNMPVDVVKAMGADIIIAVDVGASGAHKSEVSNFDSVPEVIGRTYTIMQRPGQEKQLESADIIIQPDLSDFSSSHFQRSAEIIPAGQIAAENKLDELKPLGVPPAEYAEFLARQRAKYDKKIIINEIRVEDGNSGLTDLIEYRVRSKKGPLDLETVNHDLRRIYGMGNFQTVTYELKRNNGEYALVYKTEEKYWGPAFLHFGIKFEMASNSSMLWNFLLNYTHSDLNPLGGELRVDLQGGEQQRGFFAEWYQPVTHSGRFFVSPSVTALDQDIDLYNNDDSYAEVEQQHILCNLDAGISAFEFGEFRVGMLGGHVWDEGRSGSVSLGELNDRVVGVTTRLILDQLDDNFFPSKGFQVSVDGCFTDKKIGSEHGFDRVEVKALVPMTIGRHTLTPTLSGGSSFGTELPFYASFFLGGMNSFAGYAPYQLFGNYYGSFNLAYRYRLGRLPPTFGNGVFALARFDTGKVWKKKSDVDIKDLEFGALAGLGADTLIGRVMIGIGQALDLNRPRFYITIGNNF